ncbi:methyltransferase [uncultured Paraglaciecola sp.]|uniref:class I SAM-dependent methyltransferase n=1 Tax=uncultured Paraglaciecola sp. TaxID=1765024 RepID=UPI002610AD7D|nr:methyltransferase [uncultured Paraglaciecola sp.]
MFKQVLTGAIALSLFSSSLVLADGISDAVNHENRSVKERARDEYRNPQQTLRFFDVQPDMAVAEISPGGGWYSSILAPLLKDNGKYYAAHFYMYEGAPSYYQRLLDGFNKTVATNPDFKNVKVTAFHHLKAQEFAPANSLDRVLTFRNVHNWYMDGGESGVEQAFISFAKALKKGGVVGVVEHKLAESASDDLQKSSGYMKQSVVVAAAQKAGLTLVAQSDVNLNTLDSSIHPKGVWTLPPTLALGDKDQAKYLAIGESSRMTLKFVKP